MKAEPNFSKLTRSIHNFMNRQWSKVRCSSTIEQQLLEEEYQTLLREIDYLVLPKSFIFNFRNNNFDGKCRGKSSKDLSKILKGHSKEVLKTYIANHETHSKMAPSGIRNELIHYITEIIVSRPKCNHTLCKCKPRKVSKEIMLDTESPTAPPTKNVKDTQTRDSMETASQNSEQKSNNLYQNRKINAEVQTDDWNHDPNCMCGRCPKLSSQVIVKNSIEEKKLLQDATTSDKQIVPVKKVFSNCTQTLPLEENERKCVPDNFESLLSNSKNQFFSCIAKQDCACDPYDDKEAIKLGIILPGSDTCIQKKIGIVDKEKKRSKKSNITTSDNDTSSGSSSLSDTSIEIQGQRRSQVFLESPRTKPNRNINRNKRALHEKEKITKKSKNKKNKKNKKQRSSSNISVPGYTNNQKGETSTGCFGLRKKKKLCEEHCQGVVQHQCPIQTMPITREDKSEEAYLNSENNRKAAHTSTDSEIGTRMSPSHSKPAVLKDKKNYNDEEIDKEYKVIVQSQTSLERKASKTKQEDRQQPKEAMVCEKCGRQRRDCHTACRNTIILPYGSRSGGAMPAGEAESLRMLIKMQNKDTNRQFTNLMTELNSQKREIRRLNNMYQKMVEKFYESNNSDNKNKKTTEIYDCGCSFDSECANKKAEKIDDGPHTCSSCCSDGKVRTKMTDEKSQNKDSPKRFGPANTAVAINICKPMSPDIGKNHLKTANYLGDQKRRKEKFMPKITKYKNEGSGDSVSSSLSTLLMRYKTQKMPTVENIPVNIQKILDKMDGIAAGSRDNDPLEKHSNKSTYSSRVCVWLKKSWINLKGKKSECGSKKQEGQERAKAETNVLNFCESAGKRAVGLWNVSKGKK